MLVDASVGRVLLERPDDAVDELATRLAGRGSEAHAQIKRPVREGIEQPLAEGLAAELDAVAEMLVRETAVAWPS